MLDPASGSLRVFSQTDQIEKELDLTNVNSVEFFKNDIVRYRLTGAIPPEPDFRIANFVGCILDRVTANGVNFSECDFKDTMVKEAVFDGCKFDGGAFATSFLFDVEFINCTFYNVSMHNCDFQKVVFADSDLTNLLVKSSRFLDCNLRRCLTSNKICEMSTLFDVIFDTTSIQIDTIISNFGLIQDSLKDSLIRIGRSRESSRVISNPELRSLLLSSNELSVLEKLSLEYFLEQTLINGAALLDESLDLARWTTIYKNPSSFTELLDKFAEFLLHIYDNNELAIHPILLLHHVTSTLLNSVIEKDRLHRVAMSLGGIHLLLSRIVEDYLALLDSLQALTSATLVFRADGPDDKQYFRDVLEPWLAVNEVTVSRLERNSPLILELASQHLTALVPVLAAFLATRTKLEISQIKKDADLHQSKKSRALTAGSASTDTLKASVPPVFSIFSGKVTSPTPSYEFRVRSMMPGSLMFDLKLNFSTTLIERLRSTLVGLLLDSPRKSA